MLNVSKILDTLAADPTTNELAKSWQAHKDVNGVSPKQLFAQTIRCSETTQNEIINQIWNDIMALK